MKDKLKRHKRLLPAICYGLFVLGWLVLALVHFVGDSLRGETALNPEDAQLVGLVGLETDGYLSENTDPQMIFENVDETLRLVRVRARFERDPGELELFYTRKEGQGFSAAKRVVGRPLGGGEYLYALPAGRVRSLRLDVGTAGDNQIFVEEIALNPHMGAAFYFAPTLRDVMGLLLWPLLAIAVIYTIIEYIFAARRYTKRRKEAMAHGE